MKNATFRIAFLINLLLLGGEGLADSLETAYQPRALSAGVVMVSRGMTLTQIMRTHYPDRRSQWGRLMDQIVRSNPQAFDRADPATLKLGARLRLPPNAPAGQSSDTRRKQHHAPATASAKPAIPSSKRLATERNIKVDSASVGRPMVDQEPVETSVAQVKPTRPVALAGNIPSNEKAVTSAATTLDSGISKPLYASLEPNVEAPDPAGQQTNAESRAVKVMNMSAGKAEVPYWWMGASSLLLFALFL